ncbi:unnamed protein product [Rhodiola kirilowii]
MSPYFWMKNQSNKDNVESDDSDSDYFPDDEADEDTLIARDDDDKEKNVKKGPWSPEEDAQLQMLVGASGARNWAMKGLAMNRTGKSCRLRWYNHLHPEVIPVGEEKFTPEEDKVIVSMHRQLGNKWSQIAAALNGRTDNQVKNRWNSSLKRTREEILKKLEKKAKKKRTSVGDHGNDKNRKNPSGGGDEPQFFGSIEGARYLLHMAPPAPNFQGSMGSPPAMIAAQFPNVAPPAPIANATKEVPFKCPHLQHVMDDIAKEIHRQGDGLSDEASANQMIFGKFRWTG